MGRRRYRASKAMPTDVQMLAGTLADLSAKQIGDSETYWRLYLKHPWIRTCVDLISNAVAQEGYDVHPVDEAQDLEEDDERVKQIHDFFRIAFVGKNNTFRKAVNALVTDDQTFGAGYIRKKYGQVDGQKTLVGLERLNARYMVPRLTEDRTQIDYFTFLPSKPEASGFSGAVQEAAQQISAINGNRGERIPSDEIILFSSGCGGDDVLPSPSPLEALDLTAAMDMNVRRHRNSFFENGAAVGNVLCSNNATDQQVMDAQKKLTMHHVGSRRAYRNMALGGDWKILNLMQGGKHEIDFIKGSSLVMEEICAVYKIPPSKLRDVSGAMGQSGKGEDDEAFEQECVLPIEECLYETLTLEILHKEFGIDDLRLVPARRNRLHLDRFPAAVNGSKIGMTGNELRDLVGLPKVDDPKMDIPLFLGATAGNVAQDEPAAPAQPPQPQDGDVTTPDEATHADNEVGANASKGFIRRKARWY